MRELGIAKKIIELRRKNKLTQDDLASYIGVSKASVSKWETEQSYPDITLLPQLATYFNVSIDELVGYEAQMTQENIKKLYAKLSADFSKRPFPKVVEECREITRKYYACFPLLVSMAQLYLNHFPLGKTQQEQTELLQQGLALGERVYRESADTHLVQVAKQYMAIFHLALMEPQHTLELLKDSMEAPLPSFPILAQAHQLLGDGESALQVLQVWCYQSLLALIESISSQLSLLKGRPEQAEELLHRGIAVGKLFHLESLNPNSMLVLYFMGAQYWAELGEKQKAIALLTDSLSAARHLFPITLQGDSFFTEIDSWIQGLSLGNWPPRDEKLVKESLLSSYRDNPAFTVLQGEKAFLSLLQTLEIICQ